MLARALDVEIADLTNGGLSNTFSEDDLNLARMMNLSSLAVLIIPFGNLILPAYIFYKQKNKAKFYRPAKAILSFQLLWSFATILMMVLISLILSILFQQLNGARVPLFVVVYAFLAMVNAMISMWVAIGLSKKRFLLEFTPQII